MFATKVLLIKSKTITTRNVFQSIALRSCSTHHSSGNQKPTNSEQLHRVYGELTVSLPNFFVSRHCYHLYNPQIVFEDNIRNIRTNGLTAYIKRLEMIKIMAHLKYSSKRMDVLKITEHPEDNTVRVRWRVVGSPGLSIIFMFWKYRLWDFKKIFTKDYSEWTDGFSIFYVGTDGLIQKHIIQKIIPDEERTAAKTDTNIGVKLALIIGLVPNLSDVDFYKQIVSKLIEYSTKFGPFC